MFDAIKESAKQHRARGDLATADMLETCAAEYRRNLTRLLRAADEGATLLVGCPDDDVAWFASVELVAAAARCAP